MSNDLLLFLLILGVPTLLGIIYGVLRGDGWQERRLASRWERQERFERDGKPLLPPPYRARPPVDQETLDKLRSWNLEVLTKLVTNPSRPAPLREAALHILTERAPRRVDRLLRELIHDPDEELAIAAIRGLALSRQPSRVELLTSKAAETPGPVGAEACEAAARAAGAEAEPLLLRLLPEGNPTAVRATAARLLGQVGSGICAVELVAMATDRELETKLRNTARKASQLIAVREGIEPDELGLGDVTLSGGELSLEEREGQLSVAKDEGGLSL